MFHSKTMKSTLAPTLLALFTLVGSTSFADEGKFSVEDFRKQWIAKKGLTERAKELDFSNSADLVHRSLLKFDETYRQAVIVASNHDTAVQAWTTLLKSGKLDHFSEAEVRFQLARAYLNNEDFENAVAELERIEMAGQQFSPRKPVIRLFTAFCYGKLEDSARAIRVLTDMINKNEDCPERYIELAHWFRRELRGQGTGPLLELSKSMEYVQRLLKKSETGFNPTGKRQQDIVKELSRLIDLLENKKKGKGKGKGKGQGKEQKSGKSGQGSNPLDDSKLPGGNPNIGKLQRDPRRGVSEAWGNLKKAEREDVIEAIRQRFPGQYKELIEQYFKNMSDKSSSRSSGSSDNNDK